MLILVLHLSLGIISWLFSRPEYQGSLEEANLWCFVQQMQRQMQIVDGGWTGGGSVKGDFLNIRAYIRQEDNMKFNFEKSNLS